MKKQLEEICTRNDKHAAVMQAHLHETQCFIASTEVRTQQLFMEPEQGIKEAFDLFDNNGPR